MKLPEEVKIIGETLSKAGFEAYLVGGCVRDLLLQEILRQGSGSSAQSKSFESRDWDIATNAKPLEIQKLFPDSVYENDFGTVGVKTNATDLRVKVIEVTTYRKEGKYTDKRHPDEITFAETIEEDLSRRDFTVNAMAYKVLNDIDVQTVVSEKEKKIEQAKRSNKRSGRLSRSIRWTKRFKK